MSTAKGPSSGYIYQFEVALLVLSNSEKNQSIVIECIDDIAKIDERGAYICTIPVSYTHLTLPTNREV